MNMTDPDRRHLHDLEDQLARMTTRAEKAEAERDAALQDAGRQNARAYKAEIALSDLEAELAAHRAEAERPIGVGDVVQTPPGSEFGWASMVGVVIEVESHRIDIHTEAGKCSWRPKSLTRIGRAVRMPDGSPVPEIGGGA